MNKKAFTLTELLVALAIVGAIAVLTIPNLLNNINNKLLVSQLKNTVGFIQQLASEQLVQNKTQDLRETDFASAGTLFTSNNFDIAETCADAAKDCWKTTATDSSKITYRRISDKADVNPAGPKRTSVELKNGVILSYATTDIDYDGDKLIGEFCVDINGNEGPNMTGRDYFCFYVTKSAKIIGMNDDLGKDKNIENCTNAVASNYCTKAVIESGWKMEY